MYIIIRTCLIDIIWDLNAHDVRLHKTWSENTHWSRVVFYTFLTYCFCTINNPYEHRQSPGATLAVGYRVTSHVNSMNTKRSRYCIPIIFSGVRRVSLFFSVENVMYIYKMLCTYNNIIHIHTVTLQLYALSTYTFETIYIYTHRYIKWKTQRLLNFQNRLWDRINKLSFQQSITFMNFFCNDRNMFFLGIYIRECILSRSLWNMFKDVEVLNWMLSRTTL